VGANAGPAAVGRAAGLLPEAVTLQIDSTS
jgi:hypothetical protein